MRGSVASASQTPWWWPRHPGHGRFFARRIWKQLAALRRTGSAECERLRRTILDRDGADWNAADSREKAVVEAYEALLLGNGVIDFDGIILAGLELVEKHEWVRRSVRAKYPVLVIDEYQDLGLPLHRMVLALMNKAGVRIIAVGTRISRFTASPEPIPPC